MADEPAPAENAQESGAGPSDASAASGTEQASGGSFQEKAGNLWTEKADVRCIPTTGATNDEGEAVMDSGLALEAARRYRGLELDLGRLLSSRGTHVYEVRPGLVSFPVQQYSWGGPNLQVIQRSAKELAALVGERRTVLPRPGCGPGQLSWEDVAKALSCLPPNVTVLKPA